MTVALVLHRGDGAPLSTSFRRAAFGNDDPFARHREIAWEGPDSMVAGRVSFIGELDVARFPHIETLVVVEGNLTLHAAGEAPLLLGPQAGAVIAAGTALRVQAESRVRFVYCAAACEKPTKRGLIPLRAEADFKPSASLPAEILLGPAPQCRSDNVFTDDGAEYLAGTWDSTPYHRIVRPHRVNEFMHLVAGSVRFAAPDGSVLSLGTGDAIFVPQGAPIGWESSERVAKFYVTQNVQTSTERG
ncbi:MAG TPA: cupin domain-containing protein [Trinickia sp.]|uniref:cupin domain-containing protein n=1 Tax=Trinickia sp. TaxID=2571163 RepID=UPI002F4056CA